MRELTHTMRVFLDKRQGDDLIQVAHDFAVLLAKQAHEKAQAKWDELCAQAGIDPE